MKPTHASNESSFIKDPFAYDITYIILNPINSIEACAKSIIQGMTNTFSVHLDQDNIMRRHIVSLAGLSLNKISTISIVLIKFPLNNIVR